MKYLVNIVLLSFLIISLVVGCSSENCDDKPYDCLCPINNDYPEIADILDSLKFSEEDMHTCQYFLQQNSETILRGQTETQPNGYFYNDSAQFHSLTVHWFHFYDKYEKGFLFDLKLYEFEDAEEAIVFEKFKESISREMSRNKEIHSFIKKNGKYVLYYEGFP